MASHHSPHSTSATTPSTVPAISSDLRKRKRSASGSQSARKYRLMRETGEHNVARFVGRSSGIYYIRAVYLRLARRSATRTSNATTSAIDSIVLGEDDQLNRGDTERVIQQQSLWNASEVGKTHKGTNVISKCVIVSVNALRMSAANGRLFLILHEHYTI